MCVFPSPGLSHMRFKVWALDLVCSRHFVSHTRAPAATRKCMFVSDWARLGNSRVVGRCLRSHRWRS